MIINCSSCTMRNIACGDCVVSFILDTPPAEILAPNVEAISLLAEKGLVPPLRYSS